MSLTKEERDARREELESTMIGTRWLSPSVLAKRWGVCGQTVRNIPFSELEFKEFGNGKIKRRRYKAEWVAAYEAMTGKQAAA